MGYTKRKEQEKEIKRNDIIDAAERVFFSKGYEQATMDEVAKEAEYSKRTIYVYFNSKEQIYFEIMIRGYHLLIDKIEKVLANNPPQNALDDLRSIFFTFFKFHQEEPAYFKAIMEYETKESIEQPGSEQQSEAECYQLGEQLFGYLYKALQKGTEEGTIKDGLDKEITALSLWACTIGIYNTADKKGAYLKKYHQIDTQSFVNESFHLFLHLIRRTE